MRLEFEPNASAVPYAEKEVVGQNASSNVEKMLREGVKAAQEGRRAEARAMLLQVTESDANNENAWLWLASISEYPEELLVFLNNVLRINAENERALEWHKATKSLLAKTLVQRGIEAMKDDRQAFARQCFEQAIDHEAENETAWLWMAAIADSDEEKTAYFEKVLSINPDNQDAKVSLETIQSQKTQQMFQNALEAAFEGSHADANAMLEALLEREAEMEDAWILKAHIAASFEERSECFLKLRALNPENELANAALASWKTLADKRVAKPAAQEVSEPAAETGEQLSFADLNDETEASVLDLTAEEQVDHDSPTQELSFNDLPVEAKAQENLSFAETANKPEEVQNETVSFEAEASPDVLEEFAKLQNDLTTELEETEMSWAFGEDEVNGEAEDFFQSLDDSDDIHRTQTQDAHETFVAGSLEEDNAAQNVETAETTQENEEWRNTSPHVFVNYTADAPDNSFTADQTEFSAESQQEETLVEEAAAAEETQAVEEVAVAPFFEEVFEETPAVEENSFVEETSFAEESAAEDLTTSAEEDHAPEMLAEAEEQTQFAPAEEENSNVEEQAEFSEQAENQLEFSEQVEEQVVAEAEEQISEMPEMVEEQVAMQAEESVERQPQEEYPHPKAEMVLCPFCNSENEKQAFSCASCRTVLTLSDLEMLLSQHSADVEKLGAAVASLESENQSYGLSADQVANLGIGHINLKNYRQGFYYLQEAVRMNPNNVVLDAQVNALAIRLAEIEEQQTAHEAMAKNRKILVVDDSPTVRKLIAGKLEKCGHEVICAVDGLDALQKMGELTPDLILLDITMPRMDGYQVCKMIRGNDSTKDVPVVMISGKDGFFDKVRGRMAGTTGYITKPFGPETLMKTVETYLN